MAFTVRQLTEYLSLIKEELQDKEIKVIQPNGLVTDAEVKFMLKDKHSWDKTNENVEFILIT